MLVCTDDSLPFVGCGGLRLFAQCWDSEVKASWGITCLIWGNLNTILWFELVINEDFIVILILESLCDPKMSAVGWDSTVTESRQPCYQFCEVLSVFWAKCERWQPKMFTKTMLACWCSWYNVWLFWLIEYHCSVSLPVSPRNNSTTVKKMTFNPKS